MRNLVRFCIALIVVLTLGIVYFWPQPVRAQNACVDQPAGLVAWYPGDGSPNDIVRGNNGTPQGNVAYTTGKVGQAFSFDGSSLVKVNASPGLNVGAESGLTIDTWIKPTSIANPQPLIEWSNGANNGYGAHFWISVSAQGVQPGNLWASIIDTNGTAHSIQSANGLITPNTYQHVALTYDKASGVAKLFLNGAIVATQSLGSFTPQTSYDLYFANRPTTNYFYTGALDEIGIFNRSLSQAEIQTIFNAGADGKCKATSLQFQHASYPSGQASDSVKVTVIRTGNTSGISSVSYATADGTAQAGKDYTSTVGTLNFASGEQSKTILIPILNNAAATTDTSFQITLSSASGATFGSITSATLTILKIVAGPGRILINSGNADSQYLQSFNVDGSNGFTLTPYRSPGAGTGASTGYPSVSKKTGMIAFQGCGDFLTSPTSPTLSCNHGYRVLVMNPDGTGFRQVTTEAGLNDPANQSDTRPVISPDGAKIAFIAARPPARSGREEAFVVNIDGTNLHPVTTHVIDPNAPGYNNESYVISVVWSPDSSKVLVQAFRPGKDDAGNANFIGSLYTYNADGTGETLLRRNVFEPVALDWSPDGRNILYANKGGPYHGTYGYVIVDALNPDQNGYLSGTQLGAACSGNGCILSGDPGSVRFSPDGKKIVYGAVPDQGNVFQDASVRTINLDGTNMSTVVTNFYPNYTEAKWWWPGKATPKPDHLTLAPDPAVIYGSQKVQIVPTLYDAQNNVIFHNADFDAGFGGGVPHDAQHRSSGEFNAYTTANGFLYLPTGNPNTTGTVTVCGFNAGLKACALGALNTESLSVTTATPTIRKSGVDGPGVLTIKRTNSAGATFPSIIVQFVASGQAVRDTDYYLADSSGDRISGNALPIPAGQTSFNIKIVPIASPSSGDKDVMLTLQSDESNYTFVADGTAKSATITIKDDHPEQNAVTLTSITPNKGGDGGSTTANIYGSNIKPNATVKLTRNGQANVTGTNVTVAANGSFITATFDLRSKALGAWDVGVTNPDNTSATLPSAFTIEANVAAKVWIDIIGRYTMRGGLTQTFYFAYGNRGNVDAPPSRFRVFIPAPLQLTAIPVLNIPGVGRGSAPLLSRDDAGTTMEFTVPAVQASSSYYEPFQITASTELIHKDFRLTAHSFSAGHLYDTSMVTVDPSVTLTPEVLADTDTYGKIVQHVKSSTVSGDITSEVFLQPVDGPSDPIVKVTDDGTNISWEITATIPTSRLSVPSQGTSKVITTPLAESGWTRAVHKGVAGVEIIKTAKAGYEAYEAHEKEVEMTELADCLLRKGRIDEEDYRRIKSGLSGRVLLRVSIAASEASGILMEHPGLKAAHFLANAAIERIDRDVIAGTVDREFIKAVCGSNSSSANGGGPYGNLCAEIAYKDPTLIGTAKYSSEFIEILLEDCIDPPTKEDVERGGKVVVSADPNEKDGPQGGGTQHFTTGKEPLRYVISFENVPTATAPAQTVVITDQLDTSKVDLSTINLGGVGFSNYGTALTSGLSSYTTDIDLRPARNLITRINGQLDKTTGLLTWRFTSIDPATGQPTTDPLAGFLPPDKNAPEGQGSVTFSVMPKAGLATGTEIRNRSRIIFDANAPIDTNEYLNTIDNSNPASHLNALPATQPSVIFPVSWSGTDTGSGIQTYNVYVSENGGAFIPWLSAQTANSANFIGQPSKSYSFYSVARDAAGNQEVAKTAAEASTATRTDITNAVDDPRFYVRQHYLDFLTREPDQSGWDFWTNNIESCGTNAQCRESKRVDTSAAYFLSIEFQQTGYLVYRAYKAAYGNLPGKPVPLTFAEFLSGTQSIGRGVVVGQTGWEQQLENNKAAYFNSFVNTARFVVAYPQGMTAASYVDAFFANAGVAPSAAERQTAMTAFGAGDAPGRVAAMRSVAESQTVQRSEFNRAFVLMQYFGYLRRDPNSGPDTDFSGYNFWLNKLNSFGGDYRAAEMVNAFIVSGEYRKRFGP